MLLTLKNIEKSYTSRYGRVARKVLEGLDLGVERGEKIAIVGPSGSGKTTLLNLIGTLDKPDSGEILFGDDLISSWNENELSAFRNRKIGFVFQFHHLLPQLTLWENILIPTLPLKSDTTTTHQRAEELLKTTGIWERRLQKPGELSGGECQRAAVVRALINEPELLLADEPTGALDQDNAAGLSKLLTDINSQKKITLVVVTHSMELAAKMDSLYLLKHGVLHRNDKTEAVVSK